MRNGLIMHVTMDAAALGELIQEQLNCQQNAYQGTLSP